MRVSYSKDTRQYAKDNKQTLITLDIDGHMIGNTRYTYQAPVNEAIVNKVHELMLEIMKADRR